MAYHRSPRIVTDGLVFYIDAQNTKSYEQDLSKVYNIGRKEGQSSLRYINNQINYQQPAPPAPGDGISLANDAGILSFEYEGTDEFLRSIGSPVEVLGPDLTYSVWLNHTRGDSTGAAIFCAGPGGSVNRSWLYTYTDNISFRVTDGVNPAAILFNGYTAAAYPKIWNCLTATCNLNPGGVDSTLRIYVNGDLVQENTSAAIVAQRNSSISNYNEPEIGRGATAGEQRFQGKIASAMMYNRGISAEEIKQNYNAIKRRFNH